MIPDIWSDHRTIEFIEKVGFNSGWENDHRVTEFTESQRDIMPELPEVETIRKQLDEVLKGQRIVGVEVRREKSWEGEIEQVAGKRVVSVERKAKMLMVGLASSSQRLASSYLVVHLKMTGQLIYQGEPGDQRIGEPERIVGGHPTVDWISKLPSRHTRVIIQLDKGVLFFNDQRVFGWMKVITSQKLKVITKRMPPDVIDKEMDEGRFWKIVQGSRRPIKLVILDQAKIGGAGNIYANDALWKAGIDPRKPAKELSRIQSDKLLKALKEVVNLGIKYGGATASDDKYVNSSGMGGRYQNYFLVYEKQGEKCKNTNCSRYIEKIRVGGRGTYYCPICQK